MKPVKQKYSLSQDEETIGEIRGLAAETDRSLSQYVNMNLYSYIRRRKEQQAGGGEKV